ncbi:hypothetical protein BSKO_09371 [Bryopsis sp. KO-2023]|nr:hypothetical protein BSKO_09371 [Bryopsis sp. KO-2023]
MEAPLPPQVVAVQSFAVVDHISAVDEAALKRALRGTDVGGSRHIDPEGLKQILHDVGEFESKAGGSASNTSRGLAAGFGVRCDLVSACGDDEWGKMFVKSLKRASVNTSKLITKGTTAQCVILACNGERTMRTYMSEASKLLPHDLNPQDFVGCQFVTMAGYSMYQPGMIVEASRIAKEAGARVALDLASFEVVKMFRNDILEILEAGWIHFCSCNEDEAMELAGGRDSGATPKDGLDILSRNCHIAVVTLGDQGCMFTSRHSKTEGVMREPAVDGIKVVDSTGAGDSFNAGFIAGLVRGLPVRRCAQIGCLAGGAIVQTLGAEVTSVEWQWLHDRLGAENEMC